MRNKLPFRTCVCQRLTCTDVGDNVRRSTFGSEEAIHGPNERLDYRSACWLRSQESEERTLQQCERSRPRSVATYGRGRRARTAASKAHRRGHSTDLTEEQLDGIRRRVRASIDGVEAGKFLEYEGREGLEKLAEGVKARGRQLLARQAPGK